MCSENYHDEVMRIMDSYLLYSCSGSTISKRLNERDVHGQTLLTRAVKLNLFKLVSFLIERGADVDAEDFQNKTPLFHAIKLGLPDICQILISKGADVNKRIVDGKFRDEEQPIETTYLHYACCLFHHDDLDIYYIIADMLLSAGADVNAVNSKGETSFYVLLSSFFHSQFPEGDELDSMLKFKKLLIKNGADPMIPNCAGRTPLYIRIFQDDPNDDGITAEHFNFGLEIAKSLLADLAGIQLNQNKRQRTD